jgi:SWIM zinc finger
VEVAVTDVVLAYGRPSQLATDERGPVLDLVPATVGGVEPATEGGIDRPFFSGWVTRPRIVAQMLLAVAAIARSTYFRPVTSRMLDPVLTSGDGRLRVESFSSCCGVYARADLLPDGLADVRVGSGTTNVDFNDAMRHALSKVDDDTDLRLSVGDEGVHVVTRAATAFERKVKLPTRWVKGLGESALAQVGMRRVASLDAAHTRRLFAELPPAGTSAPYALAERGGGLRFQQVAPAGAAVVAGPFRLRELVPLAAFVTSATIWTRPGSGVRPCAFQLDLPGARMWVVLSPDVARGFSGEGAGLEAMSDPSAVDEAARLRPLLDWSARLDETSLADRAGVPVERVRTLLAVLGGQGLVGRDLVADAWFRRDLPFVTERVAKLQPRVRNAALIDRAELVVRRTDGGHEVFVPSGQIRHRVVVEGDAARCTCHWSVRHGSSRGPCRHILAARLAIADKAQGAIADQTP